MQVTRLLFTREDTMARGRTSRASIGASMARSIKGGPKLTGMLMNHGVVGTGIVGGASTARPIPAMAKPLAGGAKPASRLGAKSLKGR